MTVILVIAETELAPISTGRIQASEGGLRLFPEHTLMSVSEIITDGGRRRHWSTPEKLRIVEETLPGWESISLVAHQHAMVSTSKEMRPSILPQAEALLCNETQTRWYSKQVQRG
jgi:hypothetical protein